MACPEKARRSAPADPKKLSDKDGILLHAHDWLAYFCGNQLKHEFQTAAHRHHVHATEFGRNNGIHSDISKYINGIERDLVTEAWRVIVCSDFMKGEASFALGAPLDKLDTIYNGVEADKFEFDFPAAEAAKRSGRSSPPPKRKS